MHRRFIGVGVGSARMSLLQPPQPPMILLVTNTFIFHSAASLCHLTTPSCCDQDFARSGNCLGNVKSKLEIATIVVVLRTS